MRIIPRRVKLYWVNLVARNLRARNRRAGPMIAPANGFKRNLSRAGHRAARRWPVLAFAMLLAAATAAAQPDAGRVEAAVTPLVPPALTPATADVPSTAGPALAPPDLAAIPEIVPPLSVNESRRMILEVVELLEEQPDLRDRPQLLELQDRKLRAASRYIERIDRAFSTLPYYHWELVSDEKIPGGEGGEQLITLREPLPGVTALSLRVNNQDVMIDSMEVIDVSGKVWEFNNPILLPAFRPRHEVCFLPLPTDLKQLRITSRTANPRPDQRRPRLTIHAGVCTLPESGKHALHHIHEARERIRNGESAAAAAQLRRAALLLQEFVNSRRL